TNVTWYTAATGGTIVASPTLSFAGTITYFAEATNTATGCLSLSRTAVTLMINPAPAPPPLSGSSTITACQTNPTQTLNANNALSSATNVTWYNSATGGSPITSPTLNTVGTVRYFAETSNPVTGCLSLTRTAVTLTINAAPPAPALSGSSSITQCETSPIQTLDARAAFASPTGILWYTTASGGTAIASPTLNSVGTITYYAEGIDNVSGCLSLSRTAITLTIKPRPAVTSLSNVIVCNNSTTAPITLSSSIPGSTFTWTNDNPSIGLAASGTGNIPSFLATNTTTGALTARITITPASNGCVGLPQTFTITIPKPIITNSPLSQEICSGTNSTAVILTSNTFGATFQWSVSNSSGVSGLTTMSGTGTIPAQTLYATGVNTGIVVYTITATADGCQGPTKDYVINVIPLPTQAQTFGDQTKRYNINIPAPLKGNQALIGTGKWSQSSGPNLVLISDPTNFDTQISGHIPGIYEFKWTISNKICVSEKALTLAVNAPPTPLNDAFDERLNVTINGNVGTNDTDPDGTVLTFLKVTDPASGTITQFNPDGTFIYVPAPGFIGTVTFKYQACDVDGACVEATVTLNIYPPTIVNLTPLKSDVFEGGKVWITAQLLSPIHEDVTITLSYSGDVTAGDYSLSGNLTLTIKAGQTISNERVQVLAVRDGIKEIDETLLVNINTISSKYVDKGTGSEVLIHDVFPTDEPPSGKDENTDIRPDPMTSPNDDGVGNDEFFIYNISAYPDNEVSIFNRWGNEVFRMKNYDNYDKAFRGKANTGVFANTQQDLVDGVYYYLIYTKTPGNVTKLNKGYFILKRKK
ncbi:gliding motility-associated C-terminal domain-containing protein, partial [Pedobacter sp. P351]|uniref:Ig-like domain-containing protein n=1 Tax=Pedobacter superstes TaxID=3133441 RepID=UPI0030A75024